MGASCSLFYLGGPHNLSMMLLASESLVGRAEMLPQDICVSESGSESTMFSFSRPELGFSPIYPHSPLSSEPNNQDIPGEA